jgi:hypothetical protein
VYKPEPRQCTSTLWFGHKSSLSFCSQINKYFYRKWEQKGMESLWFELRLFPIKCWGQHFYFIGTSKQSNIKINSCFIWNYLEIPFVSMKCTLSIRLSHEADSNCTHAVSSRWSHYLKTYQQHTRNNSWALYRKIHRFYHKTNIVGYSSTHLATWENLLTNLKIIPK